MLQSIVTSPVAECPICSDPFLEEAVITKKEKISFTGPYALTDSMEQISTKCNHLFHEGCLKGWIEEYQTKSTPPPCPTCRKLLIDEPAMITPLNSIAGRFTPSGLTTEYAGFDDSSHASYYLSHQPPPYESAFVQYIIGGFTPSGLTTEYAGFDDNVGVAAIRRF
ncbi:MAG: hypothetical protein JSR46_08490 [Verrucomicrobia bacterium]|nr:hypothetical protein [Verrucomicrobiota bacterium]